MFHIPSLTQRQNEITEKQQAVSIDGANGVIIPGLALSTDVENNGYSDSNLGDG